MAELEEFFARMAEYMHVERDVLEAHVLLTAVTQATNEILVDDQQRLLDTILAYKYHHRIAYGIPVRLYRSSMAWHAEVRLLYDAARSIRTQDSWDLTDLRVVGLASEVSPLEDNRRWSAYRDEWTEQLEHLGNIDQYGNLWQIEELMRYLPLWQRETVWTDVKDNRLVSVALRERDIFNWKRRRAFRMSRFLEWLKRTTGQSLPHGDDTAEDIAELWGTHILHRSDVYTFEEVTGDEVYDAYISGPESCMDSGDYLSLYTENPERVSLVKLFWHGDYHARALLWTTDSGMRVLDRIYPVDNNHVTRAFLRHAEQEGWEALRRSDGEWANYDLLEQRITLKVPSDRIFPYLDTFMFTTITLDDVGVGEDKDDGNVYTTVETIVNRLHQNHGNWPATITLRAMSGRQRNTAQLVFQSTEGEWSY